jgi:hypothetical protein
MQHATIGEAGFQTGSKLALYNEHLGTVATQKVGGGQTEQAGANDNDAHAGVASKADRLAILSTDVGKCNRGSEVAMSWRVRQSCARA